jgi:hypothetical protein
MRKRIGSKKAAILLAALLLSVVTATAVLADATMTTPVGPTWDGMAGTWTWTMGVSAIGGNDKTVCVGYDVDGAGEATMECSCVGASCPVGDWTCTLPGAEVANATSVAWRIGTWGNACNQFRTPPPGNASGTIGPTGPNAITLSALDATPSMGGLIAIALVVAGLLGAGVVLVLMLSSRRRGTGHL